MSDGVLEPPFSDPKEDRSQSAQSEQGPCQPGPPESPDFSKAPDPTPPSTGSSEAAQAPSLAAESEAPPLLQPSVALAHIFEALEGIRLAFDDKLRYDASREKVIDDLHAEAKELRQGLHFKILCSALMDMIDFHDQVGKTVRAFRDKIAQGEAVEAETVLMNVEGFQDDIEDALARHGVEAFQTESDRFDPRYHRALKTAPCAHEGEHGLIAERLRKGFAYGEKVVRPEVVTVLKRQQVPETGNIRGEEADQ